MGLSMGYLGAESGREWYKNESQRRVEGGKVLVEHAWAW